MHRTIAFINPGRADIDALTTFGVSVKETQNPIGFFGTGFKYAIAVLLRTGHKITLYIGTDEYVFTAEKRVIRGMEFDIIHMNGRQLSFTTEYGKTWEPWQAYRELVCNAMDEGGSATEYLYGTAYEPSHDHTAVIVTGPYIGACHDKRNELFFTGHLVPLHHDAAHMQLVDSESKYFYYRGVRIHELEQKSLFKYNALTNIELTEDRTAKYEFQVRNAVCDALAGLTDPAMIRRVLLADESYYEEGNLPSSVHDEAAWLAVLDELYADKKLPQVGEAMRNRLRRSKAIFDPLELNPVRSKMLERAINFCKRIGYPVDNYPIKCIQYGVQTDVMGLAKDGTIYLTERAFLLGTKQLAGTLIEEYIHLYHGCEDMTRSMQNILIDHIVTMGEKFVLEDAL